MKAFGKIIKGKIVFDDRAKFLNDVSKFDDDIKIVIEVREAKDIRTNAQNRLWWKWVELIADETGNEKQEIHASTGVQIGDIFQHYSNNVNRANFYTTQYVSESM